MKTNSKRVKHLVRPFEVKTVQDDGVFTGYGSTFGDVDYGRDVVMAGAFAKSLANFEAKGRKVPMLWQHEWRSPIGVYTEIREDEKGLYVVGEINMAVQQGVECHALMKQGALSGLSIGYSTVRDEWDERSMVRKLFEVELFEVSPVTFPMNDNGRVDTVKSLADMTKLSEFEKFLRDEGAFSASEATAFVSRFKQVFGTPRDAVDAGAAKAIKDALATLQSINLK